MVSTGLVEDWEIVLLTSKLAGTLDVKVEGYQYIPPNLFGSFTIICAILRQLHLTIHVLVHFSKTYDYFFVDQLSFCIPLLRYLATGRILFYCHFPDKLLAQRSSLIKKLYRLPFDWVEGMTTGLADTIVVNSMFTQQVFKESFPSIRKVPQVIYPCVDIASAVEIEYVKGIENYFKGKRVVLSINRFERKKNIDISIEAFARLQLHPSFSNTVLVVAGK